MPDYSEAHICQCLTGLATRRRNSTITVNGERRKNGVEFVQGVMATARGLLQLGIKPGDVVCISALNSDMYLEWMLSIGFVGGIAAPLNYRWSLEEAISAMEVARPVLLVTDSSRFKIDSVPCLVWHVLMGVANETRMVSETGLLEKHRATNVPDDYRCAPGGVALICFTSGTSGTPKGVAISHSALLIQSLAKVAMVGYNENDIYLHTLPLCHVGGISSALAMLMVGGCHVLIPKFEANLASEAIQEHKVSTFITVPAIVADLIAFHRTMKSSTTFQSVRKILNGGGGLSSGLVKDATKLFPSATLVSAYGMTEACSSLTFLTLHDPTKGHSCCDLSNFDIKECNHVGVCVGKPAPHVELRVGSGKSECTGRILTRGPHAMLGYWGAESPSKNLRGGWLETGDIGCLDKHGNLWLVGRASGIIKSGGENIYPEEVEAVLSLHPGILSAAVVGIPDSRLAEMVVACARPKDGWRWGTDYECDNVNGDQSHAQRLSSEILGLFCRQKNLTAFKIPKRFILWRTSFPMTTTGKLRRDQIRAQVLSHSDLLLCKM